MEAWLATHGSSLLRIGCVNVYSCKDAFKKKEIVRMIEGYRLDILVLRDTKMKGKEVGSEI